MAEKRRNKPIRISLTEEQIAEVIRNTVKSRKGFNVESLEDRIAPSRIGLPIGGGFEDPSLIGDGGDGSTIGGGEPPLPNGGEPPLPGDGTPPLPGDGTPPLPGADPDLPGENPNLPGFQPGGAGDNFGIPGGDPFDPAGSPDGGLPTSGFAHHNGPHDPFGNPEVQQGPAGEGTGRFGERAGMSPEERQDPRLRHAEPEQNVGPEEVSPEQLQQHRQAILRQLRGGQG